jgi:SAM-dependent methyltransferase
MIVNLGSNRNRIPNSIGVDAIAQDGVDVVHDLNFFPYPFDENSIDVVHAYHVIEHLDNPLKAIEEIHRILIPDGILYLRVPHFSSLYAWGDITHKQAFSTHAFDIFDVTGDFKNWGYTTKKFYFIKKKIRYFYSWPNEKWYMEYVVRPNWPVFAGFILKPFILTMNFLINISTELFERFWCYWVGGAAEIYIIMRKVE